MKKGATYSWYVKTDKGNPASVTIDKNTGIVTAKEAGTAYIRCKITLAGGTILRPEARVTVRNNITEVEMINLPDNSTISACAEYDLNRKVLNTAAGKGAKTQGITRWEIAADTAGVDTASSNGIVYPVKEGKFKIVSKVRQSSNHTINVSSIIVKGAGDAATVVNGETLQMSATIIPANATDKSVTWSVANGTGTATIDTDGRLTATGVGTVTVKAAANDGSLIEGVKTITVTPSASQTVAEAKTAIEAASYTDLLVTDTTNAAQKLAAVQAVVDSVMGTTSAVVSADGGTSR